MIQSFWHTICVKSKDSFRTQGYFQKYWSKWNTGRPVWLPSQLENVLFPLQLKPNMHMRKRPHLPERLGTRHLLLAQQNDNCRLSFIKKRLHLAIQSLTASVLLFKGELIPWMSGCKNITLLCRCYECVNLGCRNGTVTQKLLYVADVHICFQQ